MLTEKDSFTERFETLKSYISQAKHITFFGGAGVSTGSGIPDFRSPRGLYNNMPEEYRNVEPEYMLSHSCFCDKPELFFAFYRAVMDLRNFKPNSVHKYLAKLESEGKIEAVITQNVDMLHEDAGTKKIFKIHGTLAQNHCDKCRKIYNRDYIFTDSNPVPYCECGGIIRPDIVLYCEPLPVDQVDGAIEALHNTDLLIICGTSLKVQPAASFISECNASKWVIINNQLTDYDCWADIMFREDMNIIFDRLLKEL